MDHKAELHEAISLLRKGKHKDANFILIRIVKENPQNEQAWLILGQSLPEQTLKAFALQQVLKINPQNDRARELLSKINAAPPQQAAGTAPPHAAPPTHSASERMPSPPVVTPGETIIPTHSTQMETTSPRIEGIGAAKRQRIVQSAQPATVAAVQTPPARVRKPSARGAVRPIQKPHVEKKRKPVPRYRYNHWQRFKMRMALMWQRFKMNWDVFSQSRLAVLGLFIILLFAIMAISHPLLMKWVWSRSVYDPVTGFDMNVFPHPTPPGPGHIFGTDTLGRDVLSMLLAATKPSFIIGITAALTTAVVGTLFSVTAAYFRGSVDAFITNMADVFLLFPAPVIMVIIGARFRDLGPASLGLIYGFVTGAGATTIVMRTQGLQVVSKPFMDAARIAGGGAGHIIAKHLVPAMLPLAALQMMVAGSGAVVADGFISFFGVTRTINNWGTIIYDAFVYANVGSTSETGTWHMLLPAAISFSLFSLGFYLVSQGLHRVAAPTIRS